MRFPRRSDLSLRTILLAGMAIALMLAVAYLSSPPFVTSMNGLTTDAVMAMGQKFAPSGKVVIVDIDERSLAQYGQWPWPRSRLALLLGRINALQAGSIGLNIICAEPDRTSPVNWQSSIADIFGYQVDITKIPRDFVDHDSYLSETLGRGPFVLGYQLLFNGPGAGKADESLHPVNIVEIDQPGGNPASIGFYQASRSVGTLPVLARRVSHSGFLNAAPDADGILRKIPALIQYGGRHYPSIDLAILMRYKGIHQLILKPEGRGLFSLELTDLKIPIDSQGNVRINSQSQIGEIRRFSASEVLGGRARMEDFRNKIILVGSSASGLNQTYRTPGAFIGTHEHIHAQLLETILSGKGVKRSHEFMIYEALFGILLVVLVCLAVAFMEISGSAMVCLAFILVVWAGMAQLFQTKGLLFSPFLPTVLILVDYAFLTIFKMWKGRNRAKEKEKKALYRLRASENRLDSIVKAIPDIIFRVDLQGCLTFISDSALRYVDSHESLLGKSLTDLVFPEDRVIAYAKLYDRTGRDASEGEVELRLLLRDKMREDRDGPGYFNLSVQDIYEEGSSGKREQVGVQGIFRDIGGQKELQRQLADARRMELLGNLAAGMAHDLNNILTGLVSYPELLLMDLPQDSPARNAAKVIQQSGRKAAAVVQDLLTIARSGARVKEVVSLNSVVSEYLNSSEYKAMMHEHPGIMLEAELASDLMGIKGSPVHLSRALMNLVNNAIEAMPAGGRIRLSTFNKILDAPLYAYETIPRGEYACLQIEDEGVGMQPEDLKKVFEPYYSKKMMKRSGTGLGTTIIWNTVKDHGGYIDVWSRESEGTRMVIYLAATHESCSLSRRRITLDDCVGTEHILVVDDMPQQIEIASKMLSKLGYKVSAVTSGEAAVDFVRDHKPDLLVLDMIMPDGIDGYETYQRIQAIRPSQKVIIASGYSESERVRRLQSMGAGAYVQKPYTLETIGIAIRKELERKTPAVVD